MNEVIDKCREGTKPSSGVVSRGEAPKYELNDGGLTKDLLNQIADDMAERWGLEVSLDSKGRREIAMNKFRLWDDKHKTVIHLNKMIKHQDWIDFTNNDKGTYNLDEVLKYYDDLNDLAKDRMGGVIFETNNGSSMCRQYNPKYDLANTVEISQMVYHEHDGIYQLPTISSHNRKPSMYGLKQVLGHEAGHASTRILTNEEINVLKKATVKGSVNKVNKSQLDTDREREVYDKLIISHRSGQADDLSGSKQYDDALDNNKVRMASWYSKSYTTIQSRGVEDCAEVMSAVSFRNATPEEKKEFRMYYDESKNSKEVDLDGFIRDHQATYNLCCDYVDGKITHDDLQHTGWIADKYG